MHDGASRPVGFVGLGHMGWPMAHNLSRAGIELVVHDAERDRCKRFALEHPCAVADGPERFEAVSVVVTVLPDGAAVRDAMLGWRGGIAPALRPGAVLLEMSSADPVATIELAAELAGLGVAVVDAPVSGGVVRATSGTLSLMVGGSDDEAFEVARPVLECLGERLFRTGPLGSGHAMKALNNFLAAAAYAAGAEALAIGRRFGLDPTTMLEVINTSTGRSFTTEVVLEGEVVTGRYGTGFSAGLLAKDVAIARGLAGSVDVEAPTLALVAERWALAARELGFGADHSEAHKSWWPIELSIMGPEAGVDQHGSR